ncbi:MAG: phosphoribosylamine--glycine ligase, partial [bacterium]
GKGVTVCETLEQAEGALKEAMRDKVFGDAGTKVVIEEFLKGEEASVLAFVDGESIVPMVSAQDHKRVFDDDKGPNTGGMGAYSPAPVVSSSLEIQILEKILKPTVDGLKKKGITYRGILYAGLMITSDGPKVIEYNCRFGDPETQVILPRLKTDLVNILMAVAQGKLSHLKVEWDERPAACVVMASGGYPGTYAKGKTIRGLKEAAQVKDAMVFHSGTALKDGEVVTAGGRVLCVTGWGDTIEAAIRKAYEAAKLIHFDEAHYRMDIGWRAIGRK